MTKVFLHEHPDYEKIIKAASVTHNIRPTLIEKDYWLMHSLYVLKENGLLFEMKGGTSLSKGFNIIKRFSEDIDIKVKPNEVQTGFKVYAGKNHTKQKHALSRQNYYDWLSQHLQNKLPGIQTIERDSDFDDKKLNNGGIRLIYKSLFEQIPALKRGILLEVGVFGKTTPNQARNISSWRMMWHAKIKKLC